MLKLKIRIHMHLDQLKNLTFFYRLLIISIFVISLVAIALLLRSNANQQDLAQITVSTPTVPYVTETEQFLEYLRTSLLAIGPEALQEKLRTMYADELYGEQHTAFHYFGEILHKGMGAEALALCKDWYGFGCYHGFLLDAIDTEGYEVVPFLDRACKEKHGNTMETETCQHGIGHGLLEFTGRNPEEAIRACDMVADVYPKLGCASGVFMEYFSPTQSNKYSRISLLPEYDENKPFNFCAELTGIRLATCLFEIQSWWEQMGVTPMEVESLCNTVADEEVREFCLIGYGNFKGPIVEEALPYCDQFAVPENRMLCRAGVYWASSHHYQALDAQRACSELESEYRELCFKKGRFTCEIEKNCPL